MMNRTRPEKYRSVSRLGRFLFWYGFAVAVFLFLLPWAGEVLQTRYEGMSAPARLLSAAGFFAAAGAWQFIVARGLLRVPRLRRRSRAENTA